MLNDYSLYGLFYRASFEDAGTGFYGLGGIAFTSSGWGVNFYIGADYGLAEKHYEGVCFYIGPSYGYNFNNILLMGSLDFVVFMQDKVKESKLAQIIREKHIHTLAQRISLVGE